MYHSGQDDLNAIVADKGSFSTRIGHAGEDAPKAYIVRLITFTFDVRCLIYRSDQHAVSIQ